MSVSVFLRVWERQGEAETRQGGANAVSQWIREGAIEFSQAQRQRRDDTSSI